MEAVVLKPASLREEPPRVTQCKFVCRTHSNAKQTDSGAEKGLLQSRARKKGVLCSKNPELPERFQQSIFKGQLREGHLRSHDQLVQFSDWLIWSILRYQKVWSLVYFLHLFVVVFSIWKTQEICIRSYYWGTSERSYSKRIWGWGLSQDLLSYTWKRVLKLKGSTEIWLKWRCVYRCVCMRAHTHSINIHGRSLSLPLDLVFQSLNWWL